MELHWASLWIVLYLRNRRGTGERDLDNPAEHKHSATHCLIHTKPLAERSNLRDSASCAVRNETQESICEDCAIRCGGSNLHCSRLWHNWVRGRYELHNHASNKSNQHCHGHSIGPGRYKPWRDTHPYRELNCNPGAVRGIGPHPSLSCTRPPILLVEFIR